MFFLFPAEGEGNEWWHRWSLAERKKELICQRQGYTFFNTLMGFLMREGTARDGTIMDSCSRAPRFTSTCLPVWGTEQTAFLLFFCSFLIFTDMLQFPRFHQFPLPAATTALATHFHLTFSSYLRASGKKKGEKIPSSSQRVLMWKQVSNLMPRGHI